MLDAAYELFCEAGNTTATMEAIATRAGVAVQTLYFAFHTKDEMLERVLERTVLGDDELPPPLQPWYLAAMAESDVAVSLRTIVDGVATIFARVAPLLPVFNSLATEPAGVVWQESEQLRIAGYTDIVSELSKKAKVRQGLKRDEARDILFVVLSPQTYRLFVVERGWRVRRWAEWTTATLLRDLFALS